MSDRGVKLTDDSSQDFTRAVFLNHSAKDEAVARPLAKRLRQDGLKYGLLNG